MNVNYGGPDPRMGSAIVSAVVGIGTAVGKGIAGAIKKRRKKKAKKKAAKSQKAKSNIQAVTVAAQKITIDKQKKAGSNNTLLAVGALGALAALLMGEKRI